jgi:small multidrug resistance pump
LAKEHKYSRDVWRYGVVSKITWLWLFLAIISDGGGTGALNATNGFKNVVPSITAVAGYIGAFFFLSLVLKSMPVAVAYTIWSGVGTILVALISWIYYKQILDIPAIIGILFIVVGVIIMNVFSKSITH